MEWQTNRLLFKLSTMIKIIMASILYYLPSVVFIILTCLILLYGIQRVMSLIVTDYLNEAFTYIAFLGSLFLIGRVYSANKKKDNLIYALEKEFKILNQIEQRKIESNVRSKWELVSLKTDMEQILKKVNKRKDRELELESLYYDYKYGDPD